MDEDKPITSKHSRALIQREAQEWVVLLTSGRATTADAAALKRWCDRSRLHAEAFAEANLLWDGIESAAQLGAQVHRREPAHSSDRHLGRRAFLAGAALTAATAGGYLAIRPPLDLWPSVQELRADYRTRTGERRQIALQSGVSIDLNTRTSLNTRRTADEEQLELLSGEAAMAVEKHSVPLAVAAAGGRVRASDARFNLRCDGSRAVVTCERGSVVVQYSGDSVTVREGQQTAYADGVLDAVTPVDPAVVMAWRGGQLVFRQTPLTQVIEEVNRYRVGRIILINEALGRRLVEVRVSLDRTDELIVLVREAYGAHVTALPGGLVILT
jgi:transmembrane sensor